MKSIVILNFLANFIIWLDIEAKTQLTVNCQSIDRLTINRFTVQQRLFSQERSGLMRKTGSWTRKSAPSTKDSFTSAMGKIHCSHFIHQPSGCTKFLKKSLVFNHPCPKVINCVKWLIRLDTLPSYRALLLQHACHLKNAQNRCFPLKNVLLKCKGLTSRFKTIQSLHLAMENSLYLAIGISYYQLKRSYFGTVDDCVVHELKKRYSHLKRELQLQIKSPHMWATFCASLPILCSIMIRKTCQVSTLFEVVTTLTLTQRVRFSLWSEILPHRH